MLDQVLLIAAFVLGVLATLGPAVPENYAGRWWPGLLAAAFTCYVATYIF